tara:strand:+ start:515 stop:1048 length:534 start_codon:yes stop_codon:yes gene_type:complete
MFTYDKDYVALHTNAANSFFFKFFWRFFLIKIVIGFLPIYGLAIIASNNSDRFLNLVSLITLLTGYVATAISIWSIRNSSFKEKKSNKTTQLVVRDQNDIIVPSTSTWGKVALGYYWRCVLLVIIFNAIGFLVFGTVGNHTAIVSFAAFYLGWWWYLLFNDKKSIHVEFKVANDAVE